MRSESMRFSLKNDGYSSASVNMQVREVSEV